MPVLILVSVVAVGFVGFLLVRGVDGETLLGASRRALLDPTGFVVIAVALIAAFAMRAVAWCRLIERLPFGQALAAIHLALAGNHVLPFRLGEPLRVTSVVRRTEVKMAEATATTVLLRSADVAALLVLGAIALPSLAAGLIRPIGVVIATAVCAVGVAALVHLVRLRSNHGGRTAGIRLPDLVTVALVVLAWIAESVVVWQVARWFGIELGPQQAVGVLAAAVSVQIVAVTPGGVGTYEAAAAAALVATGVPPSTALAVAVAVHGVKTVYSLAAGAVALVRPDPSIVGRLRMVRPLVARSAPVACSGPIVLFLPAHNEEPRVAAVVNRAPDRVGGHPVEVVVVDDGSTDGTAAAARAAGATVVSHSINRGLGAAVRTGIEYCRRAGATAGVFCDADGEYDPAELATMVEPIMAGRAHYVVGSRFVGRIGRMLPHRRLGNRLLTRWVRYVTGVPVTDGQSGYRALSAEALAAAEVAHDYNYAQVLTIDLLDKGFGYHEVGIGYSFRRSGQSFVHLGHYLKQVVPTVWRQLNPGRDPVASQEEPPSWIIDAGSVASVPLSSSPACLSPGVAATTAPPSETSPRTTEARPKGRRRTSTRAMVTVRAPKRARAPVPALPPTVPRPMTPANRSRPKEATPTRRTSPHTGR
ncbi:MAG: lysylphosphatidylglycerol synthase domain-containing protein [Acidimicrobiia bacterium]|nr:lysylphosphatidylglycerol synthase domain-containing protein [Acidimicrobiia bacterium]MDH5521403.1 lysylphosphatidylglycerol synthase domain-containing protein [Acidimicrobiia bacterium]